MIRIKNKKAGLDSFIVWVIVIFMLVFLIFIYIGVIGIKKFSGDETLNVKVDSLSKNDLFLTQSFYGFLDKKLDSFGTVKNLIYEWADGSGDEDLVKKELRNYFNESNFECSIIDINSNGKNLRVFSLTNYGGAYSPPHQESFLKLGMDINLLSNKNNLIKIKIYAGECRNGL